MNIHFNKKNILIFIILLMIMLFPKDVLAFDEKTKYCSNRVGNYDIRLAPQLGTGQKAEVYVYDVVNNKAVTNVVQIVGASGSDFSTYIGTTSNAVEVCPKICYVENGDSVKFTFSGAGKCTAEYLGSGRIQETTGKRVNSASDSSSGNTVENLFDDGVKLDVNCEGLFTKEALDLIDDILLMIQIAAPAVLVLMTGIDFFKAIITQDEKELTKQSSKVIKRALATLGLFLVPTIVRILLGIGAIKKALTLSDDPLCAGATGDSAEKINDDYWKDPSNDNGSGVHESESGTIHGGGSGRF